MSAKEFILANIPSLLSTREVMAKTQEIGGEWTLPDDEISAIHSMPSNIEFTVVIWNGSACLRVSAKINRKTARLSQIDVQAI